MPPGVLIALAAIAVIVIVFVILIATRPTDFRVARTVNIAAPASAIFPHVNDFHNWTAWSPYEKRDPAMKKTYEGASSGTGAIYTWNGNNQVGEGRSTITESRPNELVRIKLEFVRPFAGVNLAEFTFKPVGNQTAVTWSLIGKYNFVTKAVGLFINMDKMIGGDFDQGLQQLKSLVEADQKQAVPAATRAV